MKKILAILIMASIQILSVKAQSFTISKINEQIYTRSIRIKSMNLRGKELSIVLDFSSNDWFYTYNSVKNSILFGEPGNLTKATKHSFLPRTAKDTVFSLLLIFLADSIPSVSDLICDCDTCFKFYGLTIEQRTYNTQFVKIDIPPVRKGSVLLVDGTSFNFTFLKVENDMVIFTDNKTESHTYNSNEVYKITKIRNYALSGAFYGGAGAFSGAIGGYPGDWPKNEIIIGAAIGGCILGGIVGALIKKEKTVYINTSAFEKNEIH
jgi:hypothetical protein